MTWDRGRELLDRAAAVLGDETVLPSRTNLEISAGQLAKAYEYAKRAYEAQPGQAQIQMLYGFALVQIGEFERAEELGLLRDAKSNYPQV